MRDLQKDLELCSEFQREIIDNLPKYEVADILKFGRADLINRFHRECREGWPYAIERALKAEALVRELAEILRLYERWEADLVMDNSLWQSASGLPFITQDIFDEWVRIQVARNGVLAKAKEVLRDEEKAKDGSL